ncbi:UNVERIFIED_CONTAM: hypothetical protein PYX00_000101 [Menopon gallinae]|uniref:Uncharacterized protein n=1 Tax=Menopon gallinae TaxID=328185 RepID=A0AAW2I7T9_9NEOP
MYPRVRETGRRLQHDSSNHIPLFRHPYEKYSYSSRNCIYRDSGIYKQTFERNESPESFADNFRTPRRGLEERNNLICQTFLTENPFFGAYYPALRPRSLGADGVSGKGSDRARSISPDFDDSKTYKITTYSCDSRCSEEYSAKSKKDDVHHFHEHHHFFHDKSSDNSDSSYPFNKTVVESAPSPFARPKKCYLSYAARESRMVHRLFRDVPQRNERGVNETSNEGFRLMSRGSSRSGRKSSDNETYTVMCKRCQKFPRDPGARVIDEERIIKQWNRGCDVTVSRRSHIDSAQVLIAQCSSHNQTEKVRLSRERVQSEKREKTRKNSSADNSGRPTKSSVLKKHHSGGSEKKTLNDTDKVRRSDAANLDHRSIILKCDHCSNVLEKCPKEIGLLQSIDVEKKITDVSKKGTSVGHGTEKRSSATKRPIVVDERKSRNVKESRERTKPGKSVRRRASGHSDKSKTSVRGASRAAERTVPSHCYSEESDRSSDPKEPIRKRRSSSYNALKNAAASEKKHAGRGERRTVSEVRKRSESAQMPSRERSRTRKRVDVGCETPRNTESGPLREFKDRKSTRTKEGKESASHKQPLKTNVSPYRLRDQSVEVGRDRKVGTEGHKPTETGKTARRTIIIRTEERSMQTSDGNLMDGKGHPPRRSTTASKNAYKTTVADPRRSGTAPGGLVSRSFPSDKAKNYGVRGSTMLSRRTVASKNSPVTRPGPFQEPKANEGLTDIGSKITDLESHLEKLEAMHSPRGKRTEPAIPQARDPADRRKQPIVVCTSTTYIMTKCSNPCGDRRDPEEPPEGKIVKREERQSPPPRLSPGDGDKKTTGEHSQTQYCHFVWPKITRALNRLGPRPETGYCDYGSSYDPLFKTGKPRVLASADKNLL